MNKWYKEKNTDNSVIISSRIRLARNLKNYPFPISLSGDSAKEMISEVESALLKSRSKKNNLVSVDFKSITDLEKIVLLEEHAVSKLFLQNKSEKGLLLNADEKISIMINEEDHIRLQSISFGDDIDSAYKIANKIDNDLEKKVDYAFDNEFGYLTSCPSNLGTGMRASFMIHIPMLSSTNQIGSLINAINKFGMTIRGVFGEGTAPTGHIYQISNQVTLGKSEEEIIDNLKQVTSQLIDSENFLRNEALNINKVEWEDKIFRSYGVLKNAKKISEIEAVNLLSNLRLGYLMEIKDIPKVKTNIYDLMINIRSGNLQSREEKALSEKEREVYRALYLQRNIE